MSGASLAALLPFDALAWSKPLLKGLGVTVICALLGYLFGALVGLFIAFAKLGSSRLLSATATLYTVLLRGVPPLLIIFLLFFGTNSLLMSIASGFGYNDYIEIDAFFIGVIAVTLVVAAYSSEVYRGGFKAVPAGQFEACHALGLRPMHGMMFVVIPQMLRLALPGLGNVWIMAIKETTLLSIIAVNELMRVASTAGRTTGQPFLFYGLAALVYFSIVLVSNQFFHWVEDRLRHR